ncbi:MAG TPA: DNA primase [Kofleriaceae bacterium]|nr:DNA primase [Kofleriaceae bacterium]
MIADDIINEIRARADIVAVIGQHVQLKKAGRNWKGLCPFHGEKTPSFNVQPDKGYFYCFGCQKKGDVFSFVMEIEGKSFVEAAEQLGARFNIAVPKVDESPELRRARGERVAMLDINKHAMAFFREVLADDKRGKVGRDYLEQRGVGPLVTDKFQLGYAPADWHALTDYLKAKGADMELAVRVGLVRHQPRAGGFYDMYRDRLVCPVIVPGGEVVGFSARVIGKPAPAPDGSEPPKYINSPESVVYKKSRLLFGLAQAREGMQQHHRAVLVEGNFDVITLHQAEFSEVIAPLGTALTVEQVLTLKRLTDKVVLVYDGDRAGYKATMHALQTCVEADVEVLVASRPGHGRSGGAGPLAGGVDPDSLVAGGGAAQLREAIDRALGGIEFFCFEVWGKARANADARTRALEDASRLAAQIANPLKRDLVIDTLAKALEIETGVVRAAVARASGRGGPNGPNGSNGSNSPNSYGRRPDGGQTAAQNPAPAGPVKTVVPLTEELEVIQLLTDHPSLIASPEGDKAYWLLTDETLRAMYSAARDGQSFLELAPVHLPEPIANTVMSGKYSDHKDPRAALIAMTHNLELRKAKLESASLQKKLSDGKRGTGDRELARLEAQLAVARRTGDLEQAERLEAEISSKKKKAE